MKTSTKVLLATLAVAASGSAMAAQKAGALNAPHVVHEETTYQCDAGQTVVTQRAPHQDMRVTVDGETHILERNKRTSWHLWSHVHANNYLRATYSDKESGLGWSDNGETGTLYYPSVAEETQEAYTALTDCQVVR